MGILNSVVFIISVAANEAGHKVGGSWRNKETKKNLGGKQREDGSKLSKDDFLSLRFSMRLLDEWELKRSFIKQRRHLILFCMCCFLTVLVVGRLGEVMRTCLVSVEDTEEAEDTTALSSSSPAIRSRKIKKDHI